MNRREVIQKITSATRARNYLEIGVESGQTFLPLRVRHKIALDPCFQISRRRKFKALLRNLHSELQELTSDEFFQNLDPAQRFGVAFIDGLHTYPQALRDAENTLNALVAGGVIVMHYCNPPTAAAAQPGKFPAEIAALNLPG